MTEIDVSKILTAKDLAARAAADLRSRLFTHNIEAEPVHA